MSKPFIVGVGGAARPSSSTELALRMALAFCEALGATARMFGAGDLDLPIYAASAEARGPKSEALVEALRRADGVVLASPSYHGGISGLIKNALDYTEDLRADQRPYFDGRAVGLIASGAGWQGAGTTLMALRAVTHALRGWPTPLGVAFNSLEVQFDPAGRCSNPGVEDQLQTLASQVVAFAMRPLPACGGSWVRLPDLAPI